MATIPTTTIPSTMMIMLDDEKDEDVVILAKSIGLKDADGMEIFDIIEIDIICDLNWVNRFKDE